MSTHGQNISGVTPAEAAFAEVVDHYPCPRCSHVFSNAEGLPGAPLTTVRCPHCSELFRIPGRLGDFVLVEWIASDSMGNVYRATGPGLPNDIAIKVIPESAAADTACATASWQMCARPRS